MRNLLLAVLMIVAFGSHTQAAAFTPDQRQEMEAIIKDYLMANPELLREMGKLLEQKEKLAVRSREKAAWFPTPSRYSVTRPTLLPEIQKAT